MDYRTQMIRLMDDDALLKAITDTRAIYWSQYMADCPAEILMGTTNHLFALKDEAQRRQIN